MSASEADLPRVNQRGGKYPWHMLTHPGAGFLLVGESDPKRAAVRASVAAHAYSGRHPGMKIATRRVGNDVHVWRLA